MHLFRPSAETLLGVRMFASLGPRERAEVLCRAASFAGGVLVVSFRDPSSDVYFVVSGRVRATVYSPGGREVTFRDLGAGEIFGDIAAIDGGPRSAEVHTLEPSVLAWLSAGDFRRLLRRYPEVAEALMRRLAHLVRSLSERVFELSTLAVNDRLHAELLRLAAACGGSGRSAVIPELPTHQELANRIGTHREAVTRELKRLEAAGLIERRGRALLMPDLARLRRMVEAVKGE